MKGKTPNGDHEDVDIVFEDMSSYINSQYFCRETRNEPDCDSREYITPIRWLNRVNYTISRLCSYDQRIKECSESGADRVTGKLSKTIKAFINEDELEEETSDEPGDGSVAWQIAAVKGHGKVRGRRRRRQAVKEEERLGNQGNGVGLGPPVKDSSHKQYDDDDYESQYSTEEKDYYSGEEKDYSHYSGCG